MISNAWVYALDGRVLHCGLDPTSAASGRAQPNARAEFHAHPHLGPTLWRLLCWPATQCSRKNDPPRAALSASRRSPSIASHATARTRALAALCDAFIALVGILPVALRLKAIAGGTGGRSRSGGGTPPPR